MECVRGRSRALWKACNEHRSLCAEHGWSTVETKLGHRGKGRGEGRHFLKPASFVGADDFAKFPLPWRASSRDEEGFFKGFTCLPNGHLFTPLPIKLMLLHDKWVFKWISPLSSMKPTWKRRRFFSKFHTSLKRAYPIEVILLNTTWMLNCMDFYVGRWHPN